MTQRVARLWERVVAFWDEREPPWALGLVRILLGLCLVYDFGYIAVLGMVDGLFGVAEIGGLSDALMRDTLPWYYDVVPATAQTARLLWGVLLGASITFTLGLFTRTSALVIVVAWVQFAGILPYADRGIDTLCRMVLCLMVFAPSGAWASVDAWLSTGSVWGDGSLKLAWARKLLMGQLVLMYFSAGILKTGFTWWPWGGSTALYFALQDPAVGAYEFTWIRSQPAFFLVQMGAFTTLLYQWTYPVVLLLMWWRRHPGRGGWLGGLANRYRLEFLWVGTGALFHVILAVVMNLGIFPWAMLALYPVWLHPREWKSLWEAARNLVWSWLDRGRARA